MPSGALTVMGRGMSMKSKGLNAEVPPGKRDLPNIDIIRASIATPEVSRCWVGTACRAVP